MTDDDLFQEYSDRHRGVLKPLAQRLETYIADCVQQLPRIDRVSARAKLPDRFIAKATKLLDDGKRKYDQPLAQIQDQIGARIVTFYLEDVVTVSTVVDRYFHAIEARDVIPDSESEFGYVGKHYVLAIPEDVFPEADGDLPRMPRFFELQIKTLFQHAWSEAGHDLAYKPVIELNSLQKRQLAFTAAQAWGADQMFSTLSGELLASNRAQDALPD